MCVCVSVRWTKRRSRDNVEKKVLIRLYCKWDDFLFTFPILRCQSCFPFFSLVFFPVLSFLIRPIHFRAHELCFIFVDGFMEMTLFDISSANRQHASQQRKHGTHSHFPSLYSVLRYSFFLFHSLLLSKAKRQLNIDSILINQFFDVAFHLFPGKNLDEKETNAKTAHQTHLRTMHGQSKNKTRTK